MGRTPNFTVSQWFRQRGDDDERTWVKQAACTKYLQLPWVADAMPSMVAIQRMSAVCAGCPVIQRCALYALHTNVGGFYAGVWLPWIAPLDNARLMRQQARRHLKSVAEKKTSDPIVI